MTKIKDVVGGMEEDMKPENQVVSLELDKELKENGYKQEGLWWWDLETKSILPVGYFSLTIKSNPQRYVAAPTVAELGERLPKTIRTKDNDYNLVIVKDLNKLQYEAELDYSTWDILKTIEADTEANARAKMWLYLKKEKLI